jgi:hypothetical protein
VDKVRLLNRIKTLSRCLRAGQFLREAGMERGQEIGLLEKAWFCTSDAVDMQWLVHSLPAFLGAERPSTWQRICLVFCWPMQCCSGSLRWRAFFFLKTVLKRDGLAIQIFSHALPGYRVCFNLIACIQNSSSSKRVILCG